MLREANAAASSGGGGGGGGERSPEARRKAAEHRLLEPGLHRWQRECDRRYGGGPAVAVEVIIGRELPDEIGREAR